MSISSTLSTALSGLAVNSRAAEVASNNVANALTEGYTSRGVERSSLIADGRGTGVRLDGAVRRADPGATAERRRVEAEAGRAGALAEAQSRLAGALGAPGGAGALATRADALDAALSAAADTPESAALQAEAGAAASDYASALNRVSAETRRVRMEADRSIAVQVERVNDGLQKIEGLNREIRVRAATGGDVAALADERQRMVDQITSLIPIKTAKREGGQIAIFSANGATLLDGRAYELGFAPTGTITEDMTLGSGALSGLTLDGRATAIGDPAGGGLLDGGALAANFQIRDSLTVGFGAQTDALARDLAERVQDPGVDPTLAPGDPGLFADALGAAFDPADEVGFAGRIEVAAALDPDRGGEVFRIRDGLGATAPGLGGDDTILRGLSDALTAARPPAAGFGIVGERGAAGFAAALSSSRLAEAATAEEASAFRAGRLDQTRDAELASTGVDTDEELSRLLQIEKAYAANARVIQTADDMLARLLAI